MVDNLILLFGHDERNFTTNGLGTLAEATECKVTEELNGSYELQMKYPITGMRYADIELGMLIFTRPNQYSDPEPFRIYSISRPLKGIVTINAQHISYDLSGYIVPRFDNSEDPFATGPRSAFERIDTEIKKVYPDFPFIFYTDSDEDHPAPDSDMYYELTCNVPKSVRSLLGDGDGNMLSIYTGDYLFERFKVSFLVERGDDKGVIIKYGKNMTELTVNEDNSTLYSAIYPFWTDQERYIELPEKIIKVREDIPDNTLLLDISTEFATFPADEDIREYVERYINDYNIGLPFSSIDISFEQLSRSEEYRQYEMLEQVELGDYVTVEYDALLNGPQTVRCTKVIYDVLLDKTESIQLGTDRNLVNSLAQQQSTLSSSTQYTNEYVQEAVKNITYDTALSLTSENAVQNKVVTGAINSTNGRVKTLEDCCKNVKGDINTIIETIEGLTPGTGSITYGYSLPTGGNDGDAYVQIQDEVPVDPKATLSASDTHNNFEITNFSGNDDKYSFDISGTVDETAHNYSIVNIDDLKVGGQYKVSFTLTHDVAQENLNVSYDGTNYSKSFGIFVNSMKDALMDLTGYSSKVGDLRDWGVDIRYVAASAAYVPKGSQIGNGITARNLGYQGFLKKAGSKQYDFYFDATQESMSLGFVFDDIVNGTNCTASVSDMEVTYVGKPIKSASPMNFSYNANAAYSDQWAESQGCDDTLSNGLAWVCWAGDANTVGAGDTKYVITFNTPQEFERVRLNISRGLAGYDQADTPQNIFVEASTDDKAWDDETKEWINITGHSEGENVIFKNYAVDHLYLDVDKNTYKNIRVRYHNPTAGYLDDIQVFKREEIIPVTSIKDLYFKIDGVWRVYPNDSSDTDTTFGYGTEDPTAETVNDIYARVKLKGPDARALISTMSGETSSDGTSSGSSYFDSEFMPWRAFDGWQCDISSMKGGWLASTSDSSPYLQFNFNTDKVFTKIFIETANNGPTVDRRLYIEGLDSDDNWNNLVKGADYVSASFVQGAYTEYNFDLISGVYSAFRIRGIEKFFVDLGSTACTFSEVQIYGYDAEEIDIDEYEIDKVLYKIDDEWKEAPSSGGGGSSTTITNLYSNTAESNPSSITLSTSWTEFDAIYVCGDAVGSGNHFRMGNTILVDDLEAGVYVGYTSDIGYCWYLITDDTTLTFLAAANEYYIYSIYGIKYGSGGGGSGYSETTLYDTVWVPFAIGDTITLSDDANNYDAIVIYASYHELYDGDYYCNYGQAVINKYLVDKSITEAQISGAYRGDIAFDGIHAGAYTAGWTFCFTAPNVMHSKFKSITGWSDQSQCGIYKVVGIKY